MNTAKNTQKALNRIAALTDCILDELALIDDSLNRRVNCFTAYDAYLDFTGDMKQLMRYPEYALCDIRAAQELLEEVSKGYRVDHDAGLFLLDY